MTDSFTWAAEFRDLFDRCVTKYRKGARDFQSWFDPAELGFLGSIGCKPREFFDFVEDHCNADGGEPSRETALLVACVRRDYLRVVQKGRAGGKTVPASELPAKSAALGEFPWLPRLIAKAEAKLRGELDPDTMFGCGGDLAFLRKHHLHPADFLRVVWAAGGDTARILDYVKTGRPA